MLAVQSASALVLCNRSPIRPKGLFQIGRKARRDANSKAGSLRSAFLHHSERAHSLISWSVHNIEGFSLLIESNTVPVGFMDPADTNTDDPIEDHD